MKSAMATLSMLLPLLALGGERGEEIWTVSRSVDDFDGVPASLQCRRSATATPTDGVEYLRDARTGGSTNCTSHSTT